MADVCHRYLHARRSWPFGSGQLLLEDDLCSMLSTWPEQCQEGCLTAERDVCRAWHPQSPSLHNGPQYASAQFTDFCISWGITHNTSSLHYPQIQWICQGMHQVHQTCTPMSQIQQCQSTVHPASTLSYTHWHQASIPSRAIVQVPTQNNHPSQDTQQWPISHTSPWADQHMLRSCQITGQQMQQKTCTTVCWPTSCNVWHPQKVLGSCYCDMCPTMEQLSSMHQQWFHILLYVETPSWMQCRSSWHCLKLPHHRFWLDTTSQWHNLHCPHLHSTCSPHPLHLQHWQPRWTRLYLFLPHQLFKGMPQHQCLWHPMPHLCIHENLAMPTWHQDGWSRKSKNSWPGLSMDFFIVMCHCIHPQSFIRVKLQCIIFSEMRMLYYHLFVLRTEPLISWFSMHYHSCHI